MAYEPENKIITHNASAISSKNFTLAFFEKPFMRIALELTAALGGCKL